MVSCVLKTAITCLVIAAEGVALCTKKCPETGKKAKTFELFNNENCYLSMDKMNRPFAQNSAYVSYDIGFVHTEC